jgi:signal transduction histidine kinase
MATMVSKRRAAERELMADLSHRLRTPMTALRLEAERVRALGAGGYRLAEAVEAMEREVDHLINIARRPYEESTEVEPDHCDAAEVVRERMAFWAAVADDQSRPHRISGLDRAAPVPLPASELAAALDALLGNVFRYTPQGTAFEVAVGRRSGYVALRVDDAGPGIASRDFALRRGTSGRGSTGLGLDIVRKAAVAARGGVDIDRSGLGGTSVVMLLADADPSPAPARQLLGFVGRLKREPDERRWGRRARAARAHGSP